MKNRAQASLFIILAVLVIAITGVFMAQRQSIDQDTAGRVSEANVVREFISACFAQSAREATSWFYVQDPEGILVPLIEPDTTIAWWPIWYDQGVVRLPTDPDSWIAGYAKTAQSRCTNALSTFPVPVQQFGISTVAVLEDHDVRVSLNQPVVVRGVNAQTRLLDPYEEKVNLRVKTLLETASGILDHIQRQPGQIPIEFMVDSAIKNKLKVTYAYLDMDGKTDRSIVIYRIQDLLADQTVDTPYIKFIARME